MTDGPEVVTNGRPGWRDVLSAVEKSEERVLREVRANQRKIDRLEAYQLNHPVATQPVEAPVVHTLSERVDDIEGRFDIMSGQISAMKIMSSTVAGISVIVLTALGLFIAAGF